MKHLSILFALSVSLIPSVAYADSYYQRGYSVSEQCERYQIREEYIPGRYDGYGRYQNGYVRTYRTAVPCYNNFNNRAVRYQEPYRGRPYQAQCRPTPTVLGGLLGGGIAAGISKKDAYAWSVPVGAAVGGALFGCT